MTDRRWVTVITNTDRKTGPTTLVSELCYHPVVDEKVYSHEGAARASKSAPTVCIARPPLGAYKIAGRTVHAQMRNPKYIGKPTSQEPHIHRLHYRTEIRIIFQQMSVNRRTPTYRGERPQASFRIFP